MNAIIPSSNGAIPNFATLDPAQLLDRLATEEDRAPLDLIDACVAHGEAMVETLRPVLDDERTWRGAAPGVWWLPLHAAFILGRIPTESAGLLLVHLMRRLDEHDDNDLSDWLAGDWAPLFANKPPAAVHAAREFAQEASGGWYMRCQVLDVVLDAGMRESEAALEAAIDWVAGLAGDESGEWMFRTMACNALLDFPRERHRSVMEAIVNGETRLREERGDIGGMFAIEDVEDAFRGGKDEPDWQRRGSPWTFYSPDAIEARQRRWREEDARRRDRRPHWDAMTTYVRATPKVGRNDPCPCGSGKKYKRCCLANGEADS
jgi:hypothetical protein